jgi:hypothetical protein
MFLLMAPISTTLIRRYSTGPTPTRIRSVAALQRTIRAALGTEYETFLQGSYRNGTALADINDVDIVARRKRTRHPLTSRDWEDVFEDIAGRLDYSPRITAAIKLGNKCVKLETTTLKADIVPAVAIRRFENDPIAVWSRRERAAVPNFPRTHIRNGARKHARTGEQFKPTVRLFKRWAQQYFAGTDIAPSFFIESAVHAAPDTAFHASPPRSFYRVGRAICGWSTGDVINSVAGDKDVLVPDQWHPTKFLQFQAALADDVETVRQALLARTTREANELWKYAFGE